MSKFTVDLRKRLQRDVSDVRTIIDEVIQTDKVMDSQRSVLEDANNKLMAVVDEVLSVLAVWDVASGKRQEITEQLGSAVDRFADTSTLAANLDTMNIQPTEIKSTLKNAPEVNARIAVKLLDDDIRHKWLEWLRDDND